MQTPLLSSSPGSWLGLMGGGQLGRMFASAAQRLGFRVVVLDPDPASPAAAVADEQIRAAYDDAAGLAKLAAVSTAFTTEFENVPATSLEYLAGFGVVRPGAAAVSIAQDRIAEKAFIAQCGIQVAPYAVIEKPEHIAAVAASLFPGLLKSSRLGYDGKGQVRVADAGSALQAFNELGGVPCVLEKLLELDFEISVVLARDADGMVATYPPSLNIHRDGILAVSIAPAPGLSEIVETAALEAAVSIANQAGYVGVLCVEFFVLTDGGLVVNEIAPRPHNSGHYTIDACRCSQFEQQVRVLAGLPLGVTAQHSPSIMLNILGDCWLSGDPEVPTEPHWPTLLTVPGLALHLYGKAEPRVGRKMGHLTVTGSTMSDVDHAARRAASILAIEPWDLAR